MGGEDDGGAVGHLVELLDEDGAAPLELGDDVLVVDDLLADVDRRAALGERELDDLDRPLDAGAERARARRAAPSAARRRAAHSSSAPLDAAQAAQRPRPGDRHPRVGEASGPPASATTRTTASGRPPAPRRATPTPCRRRARGRREPAPLGGAEDPVDGGERPDVDAEAAPPERRDEERAARAPAIRVAVSSQQLASRRRRRPARSAGVDAGAEPGDRDGARHRAASARAAAMRARSGPMPVRSTDDPARLAERGCSIRSGASTSRPLMLAPPRTRPSAITGKTCR